MLDIMTSWCYRWGMKVNIKKSETVHFRNKQRPCCKHELMLGGSHELCLRPQVPGVLGEEFGNNSKNVDALTAAVVGHSGGL